jgi:acyl-CoA hydrolase
MMNRTIRTTISFAVLLCAASASAATLTGTVTNRTTNKPSSGDTIAVINTSQSMDEIAKATSDAKGAFHVEVPDGGQILLHVTHAGADYFKAVTPGESVADIDVYDSTMKIDGISGEALIVSVQTDPSGGTLNVVESFVLQNASAPARTLYGGDTLAFTLPKGATITGTQASAPGGLATVVKVRTIDEAAGQYAFTFPVRPGETTMEVGYTLPYTGKQTLDVKLPLATRDVAVMMPKSMQFTAGSSFQTISPDPNVQSYDARQPPLDKPVEFTIAGTGQLPQDNGQSSGDQPAASTQQAGSERPGGGLGVPVDPGDNNSPLSKYKWWIVGGLGLLLAAGAGVMLKNAPAAATGAASAAATGDTGSSIAEPAAGSASGSSNPLLQTLKDELFELETDRLAGRVTPEQYAEQKAAFDVVLRRALQRTDS